MKKTQFKELFKTIGRSKVTFFSILLFVAMSIAFFFGVSWAGESLPNSTNDYYKRSVFHDIEIRLPLGFKKDKMDDLKTIEGVDEIEGKYETYSLLEEDEQKFEVRISSITSKIDFPTLIDGNIPKNEGEIAFANAFKEQVDIKIGDQITLSNISTKLVLPGKAPLKTDTYTVTGFFDIAPYLSKYSDTYGVSLPESTPVNCLAYVDTASFNEDAFLGYTNVLVKSNSLDGYNFFSKEYKDGVNKIKDRLSNYLEGQLASIEISTGNNCYIIIEMTSDIFSKLRLSLAGTFIVLGLFITFFAISRLVHDFSKQIGTKKALGFTTGEIIRFYILYVSFAVIVGAIVGTILSRFVLEPILVNIVNDIYHFDKQIFTFSFLGLLIFVVADIVLHALMTLLSCRRVIKKEIVILLNGESIQKGKKRFFEKNFLWKKLPLFSKSIVNNIFNDKRRVVSTIFGVLCSSALIVCALTLNNNINGSFTKQYNSISHYNTICYYDQNVDNSEIKSVLDNANLTYADVYRGYVYLETPNDKSIAAYLYVSDDPNFSKVFSLRKLNGKEITIEDGLYLSISYKDKFKTSEQTEIKFTDIESNSHTMTSNGFFDFYLIENLLVMNKKTYEEEFKTTYKANSLFIDKGNYSISELNNMLSSKSGFIYLNDDYAEQKITFAAFSSVFSAVVALYLVLAAAVSLLVLLNLLIMYVNEKKNELIILMINGYSRNRTNRYIYFDTILLYALGLVLGILFGTLMSDLSIKTFKTETLFFQSGFDLVSILIGIGITAVFVAGTLLLALRKVSKLQLRDINTQ